VSNEVRLWQQLRAAHGDDMIGGLTTVAELLGRTPAESGTEPDPDVRSLLAKLTVDLTPGELLTNLTARYVESSGRAGSDRITTPRLIRAVLHFVGDHAGGTVFDPACGIGSLLFAVGARADRLAGQDIDPSSTHYAQLRAHLAGLRDVTISTGDSLRRDLHPALKADLVVCDTPVGVADWGREDLLLDPRWELGVPSRAESELAWLQHCYAHTAPGGHVVMVMPASVAYRKAGRRIRAELIRRGLLSHVVALPPGMAASHALPVQLWLLRRPVVPDEAADVVRMTDLTAKDPDGSLEPEDGQTADIPRIDLLDDTVDLTPAIHISVRRTDFASKYASARAAIGQQLSSLLSELPPLSADSGSGLLDGATISVADLARAGLIEISGLKSVSISDQLDTDYLNGFLRSAANTRRSTSASGTFRTDTRGSRIPRMALAEQHRYGAAFRSLSEFEQRVRDLAELAQQAVSLARDGLTSGALAPPPADD
jgi:hypothetical protein